MGYDLSRFKFPVNPDLICFLCKHVLEDPVAVKCCQNMFCKKCINDWLQTNNGCPDDGQPLDTSLLVVVHKFVVNSTNSLDICCDFAANGCQAVLKVREVTDHEKSCFFNRREEDEKSKKWESLSSDMREVSEQLKEVKDENQLITEILKKQINAFDEMRVELKRMRDNFEKQENEREKERKGYENILDKERKSWEDMQKRLKEMEAKITERNEKDEKKSRPEIPLFSVLKEHESLVIRLKREGVIKSDKVFNAMNALDGKNYFSLEFFARYEALKAVAIELEALQIHLKKDMNVLFSHFNPRIYSLLCLAEMVGDKGSIVAFVKTENDREAVEKDHNYFLTSKRLTLEVRTFLFSEIMKGCRRLSPFHVIFCVSANTWDITQPHIRELAKQLTSGGRVIYAESGKILFKKYR